MLYLSGHIRAELYGQPNFGFLVTPRIKNRVDLSAAPWAADTGCFSAAHRFSLPSYLDWLTARSAYQSMCCFATAPDVLGDAEATWARAAPVLPLLRTAGWKAALVGQDGLENLSVEWDAFDVLFLGGTTEWKLSEEARDLALEAKRHEKWVHMGRVNTLRRLKIAKSWGCDSVDGTFLCYGFSKNFPPLQRWMSQLHTDSLL